MRPEKDRGAAARARPRNAMFRPPVNPAQREGPTRRMRRAPPGASARWAGRRSARTSLAHEHPTPAHPAARGATHSLGKLMATNSSALDASAARAEIARTALITDVRASGADERHEATMARFAAHLDVDGLHTALGYLNARTRFRYTGAYRFAAPLLCSIAIYDRENPTLVLCAEVEMDTTYCSIVGARHEALAVDDAERDARVSAHPARAQFAAYCGVPLRGVGGHPFGTLCHYDPRPRIGSSEQIELLERVAPLVAAYSLERLS